MISHTILENGVHLINLNQPLHAAVAQETMRLFQDISRQGAKKMIVNLEKVPFIDSYGLTALVLGLKLFGDSQNFCLAAPQLQPRLLFELTSFDQIFHLTTSVSEAKALI